MDIRVLASSSAGNCYLVSDGETPVLLECGIRFRDIQRGLGFSVSGLAGALLSHEHQDHALAVADLMRAGIDVYTSRGTAEALGLGGHRLNIIESRRQFRLGSWTIVPYDTVHDAAEPLGFYMVSQAGRLLYATDTAFIRYRFDGLTHVMVEANYSAEILRRNVLSGALHPEHYRRVLRNHMSLERLLDMLRANDLRGVQEIHLIHLSDGNSDEAAFKAAVMRATGKPVYVAPREVAG